MSNTVRKREDPSKSKKNGKNINNSKVKDDDNDVKKKEDDKKISITNAVSLIPIDVQRKLVFFSVLLFVLPIGSYFASFSYLFNGNTTLSALTAALVANLVLFSFVIVAFTESDPSDDIVTNKKTN